ncbi:MAG: DUF1553 domain-containing protein [Verrucomicrobiales bacterium]|nr:DUF1553 domain-containing protein [Verrucomicrobiales bacterium]
MNCPLTPPAVDAPGFSPAPSALFARGIAPLGGLWLAAVAWLAVLAAQLAQGASDRVDFNRDVRRILSENCFRCHGPDANDRKGGKHGLRLDVPEGALEDLGGFQAIVPGHPEKSALISRIETQDPDELMPPPKGGKRLSSQEVDILRRWIAQGAPYARHWAYAKPVRPPLPEVKHARWPRNPIDAFILARLEKEGLGPAPEADRAALLRRTALDLTGLPPSLEEVDRFVKDTGEGAYERMVDRLLQSDSFGEHWARLWLDQARYADSSGYADDPGRTIWAYRDYVIRALNSNKPFDQFTLEQIAGDLLPDPTDEQLVATAFHRNTMTNNEGGTNDEEFRNVAVVDRVNTTMAVWMGTTMSCAQCHDHKYDPISQDDYFRLFAILNNTADADRSDESPSLSLFTEEQKKLKRELKSEIAASEKIQRTSTPKLTRAQAEWEALFQTEIPWSVLVPELVRSTSGAKMAIQDDGSVLADRGGKTDTYTAVIPVKTNTLLAALRLEALPDERPPGRGVGHAGGNYLLSGVRAELMPTLEVRASARYLRIELPGKEKILSLAEVQVFSGSNNVALQGKATQSTTAYEGAAGRAIDGNTDGHYEKSKSTTHTEISTDPWWEVDLQGMVPIDRLVLWNRTDGADDRLKGFKVTLLDESRQGVWQRLVQEVPRPSLQLVPNGGRTIPLSFASASFAQKDFPASAAVENRDPANRGWAVAPRLGEAHSLSILPADGVPLASGSNLVIHLDQVSKHEYATLARFRLSMSADPRALEIVRTPPALVALLKLSPEARSASQVEELRSYYLSIAPALKPERDRLASLKKRLEEVRPYSTVPILRELAKDQRRKTHLQRRGNFLDLGHEVTEGLPGAFQTGEAPAPEGRLSLARWLVSRDNPLTARVAVNRFWEAIFGVGIVRTSEEFGAQGELPSHPELLDWLAVEFMESGWDTKALLKRLVTSASYRQSSKVTADLSARDPDNRLLARGPRFRLAAEMIRDQAMHVSGLLSPKMYGPPVKPPQPRMGLSAAFGSGTDWETSSGEDRYRRGIYTTWRRSNPYPSMATFDAPNREVCTVRRDRSNTPLQALVTLNDPVYLEAAQALGRRMASAGATPADKARHGFRLCLSRSPAETELSALLKLYARTYERFVGDASRAKELAVASMSEAPKGADVAELAAWTVVGNVLLNLDETLMKR